MRKCAFLGVVTLVCLVSSGCLFGGEMGLSHINHVRQLFSCKKSASALAKGRRQV